ncbi:MAG: MBL fold metallo-hydrolase [Clostridiales Family XIII bacterium]|jgi:glyoxylase-like metal-dependent hydrolase (beta-lactamase superfamily II)|nr:MBL fold metallo-hydrolase [Clostridiales Family XIII bacterium]
MRIKTFELGSLGTNCYLVWDEGSKEAFIVDPADFTDGMRAVISDEGLLLRYVILTHGHGDHVGGVSAMLAAYPGAELAAGRDEAPILGDPGYNFTEYITGRIETFKPDVLLSDGDELTVGNMTLRVMATPGHTIGGISVLVPGAVFSGDTLFRASIGRTDLPTGDFGALERSIREKLYTLPDDTEVYPGHMETTTIGYEKRYNGFVRAN